MTNTYTFPSSMTLVTSDSGAVESKDSAIARELQVCLPSVCLSACLSACLFPSLSHNFVCLSACLSVSMSHSLHSILVCQLSRSEKEAILEYEGHLASSSTSSSSSQGTTITEANSFLLNQVTLLKPK